MYIFAKIKEYDFNSEQILVLFLLPNVA